MLCFNFVYVSKVLLCFVDIIYLSLAARKYFWSTELHIYDLLFQTNIARFEGMRLLLCCAGTEVLAANLFDKHLLHLES